MADKIQNPNEWFTNVLPEKVKDPKKSNGFTGTFAFNITGDTGGQWTVTIEGTNCVVKDGMAEDASFSISIKDEHFVKMMNGELNGQAAFMSGQLKFKGSMSHAMKLQPLLMGA